MGEGYAALNGNRAQDLDRLETFTSAIKQGVNEAARRDAREFELMNDSTHLESMAFTGIGRQCDDDF
jgi:hypothetical protein